MVKDIFFEATNGKRSVDNFVEGQMLIRLLTEKNTRDFIAYCWDKLSNAYWDGEHALRALVDEAYGNSLGVNGMTETSKAILHAYTTILIHH